MSPFEICLYKNKIFLFRLFRWEFLPFWLFYIPVFFIWLYFGIRAKAFIFFSASNPKMNMGGFVNDSKYNILTQLNPSFIPKTILIKPEMSFTEIIEMMKSHHIEFPVIAKPDMGQRGYRVEKIDNNNTLKDYFTHSNRPILIQEYIDFPMEFGIMYYRFPNDETGNISSITRKEMLHVTGDGKSTLQELILKSKRAKFHYRVLKKIYKNNFNEIVDNNMVKTLICIGNHSRGATFYNYNSLISHELVSLFDKISRPLEEFYFGRFDIATTHFNDLLSGKNFKIFEVNGANAEPTHIYDPKMNMLMAYIDLYKHWKNLYKISKFNLDRGYPAMSLLEGYHTIRSHFMNRG